MDGLARAYTAKPVAFLQYESDSQHAVHRIDRFMAAWQIDRKPRETQADTPHNMVDSGQAISYGERDYQREYRSMIDGEIPRPPTALLFAHREMPNPSTLDVRVQVTNVSTTTLQTALNGATLHLVLYDGSKALKAGSDIHATRQSSFDEPLPPGDSRRFEFSFTNLRGVNLARTDVLAMLDYLPPWSGGRWDMMQAAIAASAPLPAVPTAQATPTASSTLPPPPPSSATPSQQATPTDRPTASPEPTHSVSASIVFMPHAARSAAMQP